MSKMQMASARCMEFLAAFAQKLKYSKHDNHDIEPSCVFEYEELDPQHTSFKDGA